ncbi:hypothetical protein GQ600_18295 [Phytophthora cactorum]|nr:hypothetical protein GQ600_18295 [Phytophthora cactorum]
MPKAATITFRSSQRVRQKNIDLQKNTAVTLRVQKRIDEPIGGQNECAPSSACRGPAYTSHLALFGCARMRNPSMQSTTSSIEANINRYQNAIGCTTRPQPRCRSSTLHELSCLVTANTTCPCGNCVREDVGAMGLRRFVEENGMVDPGAGNIPAKVTPEAKDAYARETQTHRHPIPGDRPDWIVGMCPVPNRNKSEMYRLKEIIQSFKNRELPDIDNLFSEELKFDVEDCVTSYFHLAN